MTIERVLEHVVEQKQTLDKVHESTREIADNTTKIFDTLVEEISKSLKLFRGSFIVMGVCFILYVSVQVLGMEKFERVVNLLGKYFTNEVIAQQGIK